MAGVIDLDEKRWWGCAGWVFRILAAHMMPRLGADEVGDKIRRCLQDAVDSNLMYVDFGQFDLQMKTEFVQILRDYCADPKTLDPSSFAEPEFHPGYIAKITELLRLCQEI